MSNPTQQELASQRTTEKRTLLIPLCTGVTLILFIALLVTSQARGQTNPNQLHIAGTSSPESQSFIKRLIEYHLDNEANTLSLGPLQVSPGDIAMTLTKEKARFVDIKFGLDREVEYRPTYLLSFQWPQSYLPEGKIQLLDSKEKLLWSTRVHKNQIQAWRTFISQKKSSSYLENTVLAKSDLRRLNTKTVSNQHAKSQFALTGKELVALKLHRVKAPFRFCLKQSLGSESFSVCSPSYRVKRVAGEYELRKVTQGNATPVEINGQPGHRRGALIMPGSGQKIDFSVTLSDGSELRFVGNKEAQARLGAEEL